VLAESRFLGARCGGVQIGGIECFVLAIVKTGTVQLIGAGTNGEVRYRSLPAVVLRADGAGLQLEFADGFR
jgi:hypothetical protein